MSLSLSTLVVGSLIAGLAAAGPQQQPRRSDPVSTTVFKIQGPGDMTLQGAEIGDYGGGGICLRSGSCTAGKNTTSTAALNLALTPGVAVDSLGFVYRYQTGYKGPVGMSFVVKVGGAVAYASPMISDYPYTKAGNYSPPVTVAKTGLGLKVSKGDQIVFEFINVDKNIEILLPFEVTIGCTGGSCTAALPTTWNVVWTGGQSNSVGTNSQTSGYPTWPLNNRIQNFDWKSSTPSFDTATVPLVNELNVGFSQTFANLLLPTLPADQGIVLINTGVGGTGFRDNRWTVPEGDLTKNSIAQMTKLHVALPVVLKGTYHLHSMLWHQGEDDAGDNHDHFNASYCHYLQDDMGVLIDYLRAQFPGASSGTPFMDGGMLPYWVDAVNGTTGVMSAIYALNTSRPCTGTADSRIFPDFFPGTKTPAGEPEHRSGITGDVIHFNATMATVMGHQYWAAYQRAMALDVVVPSPQTAACGGDKAVSIKCGSNQ